MLLWTVQELRDVFSYFDDTNNGFVTPAELQRRLNRLGMGLSEADATRMITAASSDVDARGRPQVSFESFRRYLMRSE